MSKSIAIIGAGMSGLSCASRLRELGHRVVIFEKSRGVSGRISTRKLANGDCDHGAQYITAKSSGFQEVLDAWEAKSLVDRWNPRICVIGESISHKPSSVERYVGTPRMTSPLSALSREFDVRLSVRVHGLERCPEGWMLKGEDQTTLERPFDAVVFAIPAPQVVQTLGAITPLWIELVAQAKMLPCWAVMVTAVEHGQAPFDAAFINSGPLAWIANNSSKPGRSSTPLWTLHASAAWTMEHLNDDPELVIKTLLESFRNLTQLETSGAIAHRWLFAKAEPDVTPGYAWDPELKLAACGDWLLGGDVESAWRSGQACAEVVG